MFVTFTACKTLDLITAKFFISHHCEYIAINKMSEVICLECTDFIRHLYIFYFEFYY